MPRGIFLCKTIKSILINFLFYHVRCYLFKLSIRYKKTLFHIMSDFLIYLFRVSPNECNFIRSKWDN